MPFFLRAQNNVHSVCESLTGTSGSWTETSPLRVADRFGSGPAAVAEGRAAEQNTRYSEPLAAIFRPGPEVVAEGHAAGLGFCLSDPYLRLSLATSGMGLRPLLDGHFAYLRFSESLTAGLGRRWWRSTSRGANCRKGMWWLVAGGRRKRDRAAATIICLSASYHPCLFGCSGGLTGRTGLLKSRMLSSVAV